MRGPPETETPEETEGGESEPLHGGRSPAPGAAYRCCSGAKGEHRKSTRAAMLKWGSLAMLVLQNSSLFVVTRYTRSPDRRGRMYLSSVAVLVVEICKLLICLILLAAQSRGSLFDLGTLLHQQIWVERTQTLRLAIPATCYAVQNNLVFVALSHLSAAATQVLYQMKTLSTAVCGAAPVKELQACTMGVLCGADRGCGAGASRGWKVLEHTDGRAASSRRGGSADSSGTLRLCGRVPRESVHFGQRISLDAQCAALPLHDPVAASRHRTVRCSGYPQARVVSGLPCQHLAGRRHPGRWRSAHCCRHQACGERAQDIRNRVLAILLTIIWSMVLFDFHPTALFGIGALLVAASVFLYARPDDVSSRLKVPRTRHGKCQELSACTQRVCRQGAYARGHNLTRLLARGATI